jgi:hypothetical protein
MFGKYFYNETIRKTVIAFGTLFNDITIKHTNDSTDAVISTIKVPIAYGPMQKFLARIEQQPNFNKNVAITLPRLSFEIISYQYDPTRKIAPITKFCIVPNSSKNKIKKVFMPVPYNIGFRLSFAAKLQDDALQILEQILPFFQPSYNVTLNMIEGHDEKRDIPFTLSDISFKDEYEDDFNTRRAIVYDLDFTAKTYFYNEIPTDETGGIIKKVQIDYSSAIRAPREVRYVVTPTATKDYNQDQTVSLAATLEVGKTLMTVTSGASLVVGQYIQINSEVMRVEEKDNVSIIVARGQYRTAEMKHSNGDIINLINAADHALIEVGDDFGFNSDVDFFQDSKFFSPSQGTDQ